MPYIHELPDWPAFRWDHKALSEALAAVRHRQGRLIGRMEGLGFDLRSEATLLTMTEEVVKSSEIEGQILDRDQVRSSIARRRRRGTYSGGRAEEGTLLGESRGRSS